MPVAHRSTSKKQSRNTGYAPVNGIDMYYEIHGEGAPLALIHGGGFTIASTFGHMIPLLVQHFQLIAMELQAHGRTSDRNGPESFAQDANDVATLLDHLKIPRAHIMGFSNGVTQHCRWRSVIPASWTS
jgi:pimeloyl-ACP methyl ester carboxylesterase